MTGGDAAVELRDVTVAVRGRALLDRVDLDVPPGSVVGLLGPNGSGKSTLIRTAYGAQRADSGTVRIAGLDVATARPRAIARRCAVLGQDHPTDIALRVLEVVLLGRLAYPRPADGRTADLAIAHDCLARVGAGELADRAFPTLSGGERQRVLLARALCQEPAVLLLDEPTNHLDVAHQLDLLRLVRALGVSCLVALHDLTLAAAYCDRIALLRDGRVVADGPPSAVLTPARVGEVYGVDCDVIAHPRTGRPLIAVSERDTPAPESTIERNP
jgi:iron complex transport system ATP-binding protein